MAENIIVSVVLAGFLFIALAMKLNVKKKKNKKKRVMTMSCSARNFPLPLGPKPWPLIGNLPEMWRNKPVFRWMHCLMKQLNTDIACIRLGDIHVIPVTSTRIASEILKKQDSVFASRPLTVGSEYSSRGYLSIALVPQGEQWKKMRRAVACHVANPKSFKWTVEKRTEEADNLVRYIRNHNGSVDLRLATRQYCGNVVRKMLFGVRLFGKGSQDGSGPGFEEIEHVESLFTVLNNLYAFSLSDYVPWLKVLDIEGHQRMITRAMRIISKYNDSFVDQRIKNWRDGTATEPQHLLDLLILAKDNDGKALLSEEEIKAQITELMMAMVDNPANAVEWAMAEMINQPSVRQKAVEEIDMVVGKDRFVLESDLVNLNYVKACAKEAFRLHPVAPFNLPHVSTEDTVVEGYFIPKGSHVLISRMGIGRNATVWDKPFKFDPERHLRDNVVVKLNDPNLDLISFSTGRRGCMGVNIGSAMTYMLLARLIQGFTWSVPFGKADMTESNNDLSLAKPLLATASPRMPSNVYPV